MTPTPSTPVSYKFEVQADRDDSWASNAMRYVTAEEAEARAKDLMGRWMLVKAWRVVPSDDPVTPTRRAEDPA